MALSVTVSIVDQVPVYVLDGELDIYTVPRFMRQVVEPTADVQSVVLDMRAVDLIDSSGLGALLRIARPTGVMRSVVLVCDGPTIPRLLELVGLDDWFVTTDDDSEAMRAALAADPPPPAG